MIWFGCCLNIILARQLANNGVEQRRRAISDRIVGVTGVDRCEQPQQYAQGYQVGSPPVKLTS